MAHMKMEKWNDEDDDDDDDEQEKSDSGDFLHQEPLANTQLTTPNNTLSKN